MSEKIILSVVQAERIKNYLKGAEKQDVMEKHFEGWKDENNKCLSVLSIDQMARILYEPNSFEVEEPRIKENDWVTRITGSTCGRSEFAEGRTFKAIKVSSLVKDSDTNYHGLNALRPATKEEIFWAELGREVGEFHEGDRGIASNGALWMKKHNLEREYKINLLTGFYPANSFLTFPDKS